MAYPKRTMEEKFNKWVAIGDPDDCWLFTGRSFTKGYGLLTDRPTGEKCRAILCHRWAYEFFCGPIPDGYVVRHTCDNPLCNNPKHLIIGTVKDNSADMVERGRHRNQKVKNCPFGHSYDTENTAIHKTTGSRICKACDRERHRIK